MKRMMLWGAIIASFAMASIGALDLFAAADPCVWAYNYCTQTCSGTPQMVVQGDGRAYIECLGSQAPCPPNWISGFCRPN